VAKNSLSIYCKTTYAKLSIKNLIGLEYVWKRLDSIWMRLDAVWIGLDSVWIRLDVFG
jgi:hypothetical protein